MSTQNVVETPFQVFLKQSDDNNDLKIILEKSGPGSRSVDSLTKFGLSRFLAAIDPEDCTTEHGGEV